MDKISNKDQLGGSNTYVWLIWMVVAIFCSVLTYNPVYLSIIGLSAILISKKNNISIKHPIMMGVLFSIPLLIINILLVHHGKTVLYQIPQKIVVLGLKIPLFWMAGPITLEAILAAFIFSLLLITLFLIFSVFNTLTTSDTLIKVFPKSLVHSSLVASIALRFAPMIAQDFKSITDVQRTRGLRLGKVGVLKAMKSRISIIIPTVVNSLEKSYNLAEAMESRCYTGNRSRYSIQKWGKKDTTYLVLLAIPLLYLISLKITGSLDYWNALSAASIIPEIRPAVVASLMILAVPAIENEKHHRI